MSRWARLIVMLFSLIMAVVFAVSLMMLASEPIMTALISYFYLIIRQGVSKFIAIAICGAGFATAVASLVTTILNGRLRKARIRKTEKGFIDIGVDAIENIALNSAIAAQAGIKSAKARVMPSKANKIKIALSVMAYSDVELPAMMAKVQERVRKDVARFTGIEVAEVVVRVSRVESMRVGVER